MSAQFQKKNEKENENKYYIKNSITDCRYVEMLMENRKSRLLSFKQKKHISIIQSFSKKVLKIPDNFFC